MRKSPEWYRRYHLFENRNYRMKKRDTQAVLIDHRTVKAAAEACNGTVILLDDYTYIIRFEGLHGTETVVEGEYLVRTLMPGEDYYAAMSVEKFEKTYEKVTWSEMKEKNK